MPNKLELILLIVVVSVSLLVSGVLFPLLVSTNKLSVTAIVILFLIVFYVMIIGFQAIANYFYVRWQRRNDE